MKTVIFLLAFALIALPSQSFAAIGKVTIDGQEVPAVLFEGYSIHGLSSANRCPPTSDAYIRDIMIRRALIIFAAQKRALPIPERDQNNIDEFEQKLKYLGPDGNARDIAVAEYLKSSYQYGAYIDHYPALVSHTEILDEYRRLIKAKDPRFTDVIIVRRTPLEFTSAQDAIEATAKLKNGSSLEDVIAAYEDGWFSTHLNVQWTPIYDIDDYQGDGTELQNGSIVSLDERRMIYFNEVKFRTRLRPFTEYRNNEDYVYKEVKWDVLKVKQRERDLALWQAADVREDGEPVEMSITYPACP